MINWVAAIIYCWAVTFVFAVKDVKPRSSVDWFLTGMAAFIFTYPLIVLMILSFNIEVHYD